MKSKMVIFVLILLLMSMKDAQSQISNKLSYHRVAQNNSVWYYAARIYGLSGTGYDYVLEELGRIYGEDSLAGADNTYKIMHSIDSLKLWDIRSIEFMNDSQVRVYGTYFIKSYNLGGGAEKNMFIEKRSNGDNAIMKVHTDIDGKRYVKRWEIDGYIDVNDKNLISIEVINKNKWFYSERDKSRFLSYYELTRFPVKIGYCAALIASMFIAYNYLGK